MLRFLARLAAPWDSPTNTQDMADSENIQYPREVMGYLEGSCKIRLVFWCRPNAHRPLLYVSLNFVCCSDLCVKNQFKRTIRVTGNLISCLNYKQFPFVFEYRCRFGVTSFWHGQMYLVYVSFQICCNLFNFISTSCTIPFRYPMISFDVPNIVSCSDQHLVWLIV